MTAADIKPFPRCPARAGYHCQTNSLAKMYHFHGRPLSEEMLFGLGAGPGFIYWRSKKPSSAEIGGRVFIGGRGNNRDFFTDVGRRTGVSIAVNTTAGAKKAEAALLAHLGKREPVMVFGDMAYLPWFDFGGDYHFGGHTFVVCGFDGRETALASDMDPKAAGLKKGFYHPISLGKLKEARNSPYKPFPPKNAALEFDFSGWHEPRSGDCEAAVQQAARAMIHPPIKNFGVKGIRHTAGEIVRWPGYFKDRELRFNLFQIYVFIEIGGTGGGFFRPMYARFLKEAARITGRRAFASAAASIDASGRVFAKIAGLFKNAKSAPDIKDRLAQAAEHYDCIAELEGQAFRELEDSLEGDQRVCRKRPSRKQRSTRKA